MTLAKKSGSSSIHTCIHSLHYGFLKHFEWTYKLGNVKCFEYFRLSLFMKPVCGTSLSIPWPLTPLSQWQPLACHFPWRATSTPEFHEPLPERSSTKHVRNKLLTGKCVSNTRPSVQPRSWQILKQRLIKVPAQVSKLIGKLSIHSTDPAKVHLELLKTKKRKKCGHLKSDRSMSWKRRIHHIKTQTASRQAKTGQGTTSHLSREMRWKMISKNSNMF